MYTLSKKNLNYLLFLAEINIKQQNGFKLRKLFPCQFIWISSTLSVNWKRKKRHTVFTRKSMQFTCKKFHTMVHKKQSLQTNIENCVIKWRQNYRYILLKMCFLFYRPLPLFDPVVLYCITSLTSFDNRATFILYLLSYDKGRPSLGDMLFLVPCSVKKKKKLNFSSSTVVCVHFVSIEPNETLFWLNIWLSCSWWQSVPCYKM